MAITWPFRKRNGHGWVGCRRPKKCVASSSKGSSDSPTSFSGVGKRKMPQANPSCPRTTFAKNKKVLPSKRIFGARAGCGDVTSLYKNLVKNRKTNFRRQAIQEPIHSMANTDFEGDYDGRGCTCGTFLVICAQPSHRVADVSPRVSRGTPRRRGI